MINKLKLKRNNENNEKNNNKHKKLTQTFSRDFVIGIIEIDKKNIKEFIRSEVLNYLQTDDYYYGYFYKEGKLHYVAHKSNKDETGKISKLAYVLMHEGSFYIIQDKTAFRFTNKKGTITQTVDYSNEINEEHKHKIINIENKEIQNPPETLIMQWSLKQNNYYITAFAAIIFAASIAFYTSNTSKYDIIKNKAAIIKQQIQEQEKAKQYEPIADLSQPIRTMATKIGNRGEILSVKGAKNELAFTIKMKTENDSRTFIKEMGGGNYENGKIILNTKYIANK